MRIVETPISGVLLIEVDPHHDARGLFARIFDAGLLTERGMIARFDQHSIAWNATAGTVRGLHFQTGESAETKIVRCIAGALFDVAVDLRPQSATYGQWTGVELTAANRSALYLPRGVAHGYQTLVDGTEALYLIDRPYDASAASGVHYADETIGVTWPLPVSCISDRDAALPRLDRV